MYLLNTGNLPVFFFCPKNSPKNLNSYPKFDNLFEARDLVYSYEKRGEVQVKYEVYADVLSGLIFLYNWFVLKAINQKLSHISGRVRRLTAAFMGTVCTMLTVVLAMPSCMKGLLLLLVNPLIMLAAAYPIRQLQGLQYLCKYYCVYTIFFGAALLFLKNLVVLLGIGYSAILLGILGLAGLTWYRYWRQHSQVQVELYLEEKSFQFEGFVDTGNTLVEPFSKKGVNVLVTNNEEAKRQLMKGKGFVVPYKTIGTGNGILMGYLVHKMSIISNGLEKKYEDVLVAVSPQRQEGEFVILSSLLAEK